MVPYDKVVSERYDGREVQQSIYENIYSIINPVGFYGHITIEKVIYKIINLMTKSGVDISDMDVLDVGCGSGAMTRILSEFMINPSRIVGVDLSQYRIGMAKNLAPNIQYIKGDIVKGTELNKKFDLVTCFDVFMHFDSEEIISKAMNNIYAYLKPNGLFVWYDAYAKDHFHCSENAECNGFSSYQMDAIAKKFELVKIYDLSVHKNLLGKINSIYLYGKLPLAVIKMLEIIIPGKPGNMVKVFMKKNVY